MIVPDILPRYCCNTIWFQDTGYSTKYFITIQQTGGTTASRLTVGSFYKGPGISKYSFCAFGDLIIFFQLPRFYLKSREPSLRQPRYIYCNVLRFSLCSVSHQAAKEIPDTQNEDDCSEAVQSFESPLARPQSHTKPNCCTINYDIRRALGRWVSAVLSI